MPNSIDVKVVEDGHRNAVVKIVGVLDTSDLAVTPAIPLGLFSGNNPALTLSALGVEDVNYAGSLGLVVNLDWNSAGPQPICAMDGEYRRRGVQGGVLGPDQTKAGFDGAINLSTRGYVPGKVYGFTLELKLVKKYTSS